MKPQTVLKIDPVGKSTAQIYARRDQWIAEYEKYIREHPECSELGAVLIDRVTRAAEMLVRRYAQVPLEEQEKPDPESDFHYDDYNPAYKEENASLDGNFPLGDAYDADFATPYFPIEHLVLIQFGDSDKVPRGHYVEPAYDVLVRQGFLHELNQQWREAEACYRGGGMSKSVSRRERDCRRQKNIEGEMAYGKALYYMEIGDWSQAYPYLQQAVELEYADAMVDMGLAWIHGNFDSPADQEKGMKLLTQATWQGSQRAHKELAKLRGEPVEEETPEEVVDGQAKYLEACALEHEKELDRAIACYQDAAEAGIMAAMLRLYEIYKDGLEHIPANQEKASRYLWMSGVGRP